MKRVTGKGHTFADVIAEAQRRAAAEEAKFNAMTPQQKKVYLAEREKQDAETEEILKKLRGPGFMEIGGKR